MQHIRLFIVPIALCLSSIALAQAPAPAAPSKEMREHMAQLHEKMAVCLRSDRSVGDCRAEMHQECMSMGAGACGMMGPHGGGMMKGPMKGPMNGPMNGPMGSSSSSSSKP